MEEEPDIVEEPVYKLSPEEEVKLKQAREDIAQGKYYTNDEAEKRLDKWFGE